MKLNSKECKTALENYQIKNNVEKLAIEVLLAKAEDIVSIPEIAAMDDDALDELAVKITNIRTEVGIEDE